MLICTPRGFISAYKSVVRGTSAPFLWVSERSSQLHLGHRSGSEGRGRVKPVPPLVLFTPASDYIIFPARPAPRSHFRTAVRITPTPPSERPAPGNPAEDALNPQHAHGVKGRWFCERSRSPRPSLGPTRPGARSTPSGRKNRLPSPGANVPPRHSGRSVGYRESGARTA